MNCNQAQAMLAAYRELKNGDFDSTELDVHLEQCATCRQALARYHIVGERIRSLSPIEPAPHIRARLMQALAAEHSQFLQHSTSSSPPPVPAFLKPYLNEHAYQADDSLTAFSTAETGPLPMIRKADRKRRSSMGQIAVIALVASVLIVLMTGGLTSLLLLAHGNPGTAFTGSSGNSINIPSNVVKIPYTTNTAYTHVVSAVGERNTIYYTAYADGSKTDWMLEELDRDSKVSLPLLDGPANNPLVVLGSSNGWVAWLQFDLPSHTPQRKLVHDSGESQVRTWSLHLLSLTRSDHRNDFGFAETQILLSGTFDPGAVPSWVHTPIQDIWFTQNTLLVAAVDADGTAHLWQYQLDWPVTSRTEIATTNSNHILTSPTATSDGSVIYWSEEWQDNNGILRGNIWTRRITDVLPSTHGRWDNQAITLTYPFRSDGISFEPQVVNNTLFYLSTTDVQALTNATPGTTATALVIPTISTYNSTVARADSSVSAPQLDAWVHGILFAVPADSDPAGAPAQVSSSLASTLQAGSQFLLWQTDNGNGYGMLDVTSGDTTTYVIVGEVLDGARFVSVNGDTTVWTPGADPTSSAGLSTTLLAFNWPK